MLPARPQHTRAGPGAARGSRIDGLAQLWEQAERAARAIPDTDQRAQRAGAVAEALAAAYLGNAAALST